MACLAPGEETSAFLKLPFETRLQIYSYLIPQAMLEIDLCTARRAESSSSLPGRRRSVISNLVSQTLELETITRCNGLHLLLVSSRTRSEVKPLLSKLPVRFHCPKCFDEWLRNLSHGLGVGVRWMKRVEIIFECAYGLLGPPHRPITMNLAKFMVTEAMQAAQRTVWMYYGRRLDLADQEKWRFDPIMNEDQQKQASSNQMALQDPNQQQQAAPFNGQIHPIPQHGLQPVVQQGLQQLHLQNQAAPNKWIIKGWFDI